jgi:cellobiose phosphorylase
VRNRSGRARRLSATGYVEWVLGDLRPKTTMHVITEIEGRSGALLARNAYNTARATIVALQQLRTIEQVAAARNKPVSHLARKQADNEAVESHAS